MKIITHEDQATLKKLIGKTFDNAAIACHKEARKGRVCIDDPKLWKGAHSPVQWYVKRQESAGQKGWGHPPVHEP
jgi:hypothetical protein